MDAHLGYGHSDRKAKDQVGPAQVNNHRNGAYTKTVESGYGAVEITVPRNRAGTFAPQMVPKGTRRLRRTRRHDYLAVRRWDDRARYLPPSFHHPGGGYEPGYDQHHYRRGLRRGHDLAKPPTRRVLPSDFLDALRVKIRDGHRVVNKACYMAVGIDIDGIKHILGLWIADNEGAAFWASVCADLANRGVQDVFIVCCDGLKGLPEAVEATWPNSMVRTCIVHLIRAANRWVSYQDRKAVSRMLRDIYTAANEDTARASLDAFKASELGRKYPQSVKVWRDAWERFVPFLQFPPAARRVLYTTNSIESLSAQLRKATRNRGQFPNDAAALKTLWLMICNIEDKRAAQRAKKAKREIECNGYIEGAKATGWKQTINQLAVAYPDRFADYL